MQYARYDKQFNSMNLELEQFATAAAAVAECCQLNITKKNVLFVAPTIWHLLIQFSSAFEQFMLMKEHEKE